MQRMSAGRLRYWLLIYGITIIVAAGCYLYLQQEIMHRTYRLHALQNTHKALCTELKEVQEAIDEYRQPDNLRRRAYSLGLQMPLPSQYLTIPDDGAL
jgi:hypothetical protein